MKYIIIILSAISQRIKLLFRDLRYSNSFRNDKTTLSSSLLISGHVLEKGITMPNRRLGFGYDIVRGLIKNCNDYISKYGSDSVELQAAIADLSQYLDIHKKVKFEIPSDIQQGIEVLISELVVKDENCYYSNSNDYFRKPQSYYEFANQRRSIRSFSEEDVDEATIMKAIELAQTAPSACNRQSIKVKIIENHDVMKIIYSEIQNGNRGFGHLANKWLLITSELGAWSQSLVNMAYIDGGIFTMSLLNALHYYGICACTLNANLSTSNLKKLRELIQLPKSEVCVVFIAIGKPAKSFMIAKSRRKQTKDIVTIIK